MAIERDLIIDMDGLILGRAASVIAKKLLNGSTITVVNADKAAVSGRRSSKVNEFKRFLEIGHPKKGPYHPRRPDRLVQRTIRGMLPYRSPKGQQALKRLRVYIGVPRQLEQSKFLTILEASSKRLKCPYTTIGEIATEIGWQKSG